jgi:hypothetical protein
MTASKRIRAVKDRRSTWARRHRELADAFALDLGTELSAADRSIAAHAATIAIECEKMRVAQLNGETIDLEELVRLTNALTRVRKELGQHTERGKRDPVADSWLAAQEQLDGEQL